MAAVAARHHQLVRLDLLQQASRATSTSEALRLIEQAKLLVK
jgi:hypothetical protein